MKNNIDRFTFFESYDAVFETIRKTKSENEIDALKKEIFLFRALRDFVFRGIEPENFPSVELKMVWEILKPNLINSIEIEERNAKLRENGRNDIDPEILKLWKIEKFEDITEDRFDQFMNKEYLDGLKKHSERIREERNEENSDGGK